MDINVQCRLCAEFKDFKEVVNVKKNEAVESNLEFKIEQCLNINFIDVTLPKHVCLPCCHKVSSSFEFREQVTRAQDFLKPCLIDIFEETENDIKDEFQDEDFNFIESLDQNDYPEQTNDSEDSDFGKPLSAIKIKVERKKKRVKKKEEDAEKRYSGHGELIRKSKDDWKAYTWKCATCSDQVATLDDLRIHFSEEHNEEPRYTCMECSKIYDSYNNFKRHVSSHRNKAKYQCPICLRTFHRNMHYKDHLETHTTEKKYQCPKCGKNYKTSSSLRGHLRRHIVKPVIIPKFECTICNKKVMTRAYLIYHEKSHYGIKDFTCEECGKRFMKESNLQYHMNSAHSDEKPYECEHCHKQFKQQKLLKTHMQVHSEDKRHSCDVCGLRFHRKDTLTRHSSVHTGVLAFSCDYCQKRFRTKQLMKVHVRQHTGERPYSCSECFRTFIDSSNYVKHMRGKHGIVGNRRDQTYKIPMVKTTETQGNVDPPVTGNHASAVSYNDAETKPTFVDNVIDGKFIKETIFSQQDNSDIKPIFNGTNGIGIMEPQLNIVATTQMVLDAARLIE